LVKNVERLTDEQYQKYFDSFTSEHYNPKEWARLAKKAGMKYAVLTTKHHEGFCLFDSKYTDYKSTNCPAGRDLVKEFVEAFRAEGIKIGFYYSLLDWHHPDYPHCGDTRHPQRDNPDYPDEGRNWDNYLEYMHNQVRELCTNYGKIDIMWFDFSYDDMKGEKWGATKLVEMVRSLQPDILIDNRLMGAGYVDVNSFNFDELPIYCGDFVSPEQVTPSTGILDCNGRAIPWEACITTQQESWGYVEGNDSFMSARDVIYMLVDCVSKNGNLIINVGPTAKGEFPKQSVELLEEVGEWMRHNGESIYGCGSVDLPQPEWGRLTGKDGVVYAHFFDKSGYCLSVNGLEADKVDYGLFVEDYAECKVGEFWNKSLCGTNLAVPFKKAKMKNKIDTVIKLVLKK
jgi:alpha-L-fucosidase